MLNKSNISQIRTLCYTNENIVGKFVLSLYREILWCVVESLGLEMNKHSLWSL
eukprot:GAHX01005505.1.p1 GENE.GAHX01005505.1~~GAHX01005505.1.p1  ORF type:complete len:53 (-),score=1.45 GAHX01005505.1:142-300(-)